MRTYFVFVLKLSFYSISDFWDIYAHWKIVLFTCSFFNVLCAIFPNEYSRRVVARGPFSMTTTRTHPCVWVGAICVFLILKLKHVSRGCAIIYDRWRGEFHSPFLAIVHRRIGLKLTYTFVPNQKSTKYFLKTTRYLLVLALSVFRDLNADWKLILINQWYCIVSSLRFHYSYFMFCIIYII